jgi:type II secretory pathway component PulJ
MELILTVALLGVLAAGAFGVIFWQTRTYMHIEQRSEAMAQLQNTYLLMYKNIKNWRQGSIDSDSANASYIASNSVGIPDFSYNSTTKEVLWQNEPILINASASFKWSPAEKLVIISLQKLNRNSVALRFVVYPRNP